MQSSSKINEEIIDESSKLLKCTNSSSDCISNPETITSSKQSFSKQLEITSSETIKWHENIAIVAPTLFLISIIVGFVVYCFSTKWDYSTCLYYSIQVIVGAMYGVPSETSPTSQIFTMILFVWGSLLAAGVLGALGLLHFLY
jgi:hypothetical protein